MKKNNCILVICLLVCISTSIKSQVLKIENGIAFANQVMKVSGGGKYTGETIHPYQVSAGIEYMNKDWYYLSSSIGYLRKGEGGILDSPENGTPYQKLTVVHDYITANTTFRAYKSTTSGFEFYAGAGPRLDYILKSKFEGKHLEESIELSKGRKVIVGLKGEVGINYRFGKMLTGLNFSYLPSFMKQHKDLNIRDRTFTLGLVLGYVIN